MSRRETILDRLHVTTLPSVPGLAAAQIDRNRTTEVHLDREALPRALLYDGSETVIEAQTGEDRYRMALTVDLYVGGEVDAELGPALNTLYGNLVRTLTADPSLGGLTQDIRSTGLDDPELLTEPGTKPVIAATATFDLWYATAERDPFSAP